MHFIYVHVCVCLLLIYSKSTHSFIRWILIVVVTFPSPCSDKEWKPTSQVYTSAPVITCTFVCLYMTISVFVNCYGKKNNFSISQKHNMHVCDDLINLPHTCTFTHS